MPTSRKYKLFGDYEFGTATNTYLQEPTDSELSNLGLQRSGIYSESIRKFWSTDEALAYVDTLLYVDQNKNSAVITDNSGAVVMIDGAVATTTETPAETPLPEVVVSTTISNDGNGLITVSTRTEKLEKTPDEDTKDEEGGGSGGGEGEGGEGGEGGITMKPRPVRDVKSISTSMAMVKDNVLLHINATEEQKGYLAMYIGGATGFELIPDGTSNGATTYTMLKNKLDPSNGLVNFCRMNPTINLPVITVTISYTAKVADNVAGGQDYPGKVPSGMSAICTSVTSSPISGNKRKKSYVETWQMGYFNNANSALIKQYTGIDWPPSKSTI